MKKSDIISGRDQNVNGVWDYIDTYINEKFQGQKHEGVRAAARQYSRALQGDLLNANNKNSSLQFASVTDRTTECMFYHRPQRCL